MLNVEKINQCYGESHARWGEQEPFTQWVNAVLRTRGMEAGLDCHYTDVRHPASQTGARSC